MAGHSGSIIEFPQDRLVHIQWKSLRLTIRDPQI